MQEKDFSERLKAVRANNEEKGVAISDVYTSGQIALMDENASTWDNFDRYYKFVNISY